MAVKYLSNRVKDLQVGITNYSENKPKSLYVVGNVGIGTTNPTAEVGISVLDLAEQKQGAQTLAHYFSVFRREYLKGKPHLQHKLAFAESQVKSNI